MIFTPTQLPDIIEIEIEPIVDERGFFSRLFCPEEFNTLNIDFRSTQINLSRNSEAYTLRGMHYQESPYSESKIVRVTSGSIFDVVVDIRAESKTRYKWISRFIDARRANALFIPEGYAHGFLTLEPETDVQYQMGRPFVAGYSRGMRYDDPVLAIDWPAHPKIISEQDKSWPPIPLLGS